VILRYTIVGSVTKSINDKEPRPMKINSGIMKAKAKYNSTCKYSAAIGRNTNSEVYIIMKGSENNVSNHKGTFFFMTDTNPINSIEIIKQAKK
jgi:hypothetical protein